MAWVSKLPQQSEENVDFNDEFYRSRLRALQAVDELVEGVLDRLAKAGIFENTYVFYTSDNGYHIGQHRLQPGKECGFEEDINVPLIVRGPGVKKRHVSDTVTSHTDLAPTLLTLAGANIGPDFDGAAIPITSAQLLQASDTRSEHVNIEYWGFALVREITESICCGTILTRGYDSLEMTTTFITVSGVVESTNYMI